MGIKMGAEATLIRKMTPVEIAQREVSKLQEALDKAQEELAATGYKGKGSGSLTKEQQKANGRFHAARIKLEKAQAELHKVQQAETNGDAPVVAEIPLELPAPAPAPKVKKAATKPKLVDPMEGVGAMLAEPRSEDPGKDARHALEGRTLTFLKEMAQARELEFKTSSTKPQLVALLVEAGVRRADVEAAKRAS